MRGVLLVDKTEGPTSHDAVAAARRALDTGRVGHTGTLDPFATGLLVLLVGQATKLAQYLTGYDKTYEATARLGVRTDTLDRTGTAESDTDAWRALDEAAIRAAFEAHVGERQQVPPAYSAKKVGGKKSYELARAGQAVELAPVEVTIHALEVIEIDGAVVRFRMRSSTGTYVRSVARDVGDTLEVGAHLMSLRRTAVGPYDVADAVGFDTLLAAGGKGPEGAPVSEEASARARAALDVAFLKPLEALSHLPRLELDAAQRARVEHGQSIEVSMDEGLVALVSDGALMAMAESNGRWVRPRKVFA